jgi:hypothetical protein
MPASFRIEPVAGTCNRHLGEKQRRAVGSDESGIGRQSLDAGVPKLYFDGAAQLV